MRETIEAGGRDSRWEFSKAMLFEKTAHQASVCSDLAGCISQTATFRKFLSPHLRTVTGNPRVRYAPVLAPPHSLLPCNDPSAPHLLAHETSHILQKHADPGATADM